MQYLIFDNMNECSRRTITDMLPLVSPQRQLKAMRFQHLFGQFACLKSFVMLSQLMHWTTQQAVQVQFVYNEYGQPSLSDEVKDTTPTPCFSISHCKHAIAVAVSELPIGVDVESIRSVDEALIERTMNEQEQACIRNDTYPARAFTELWTRKESLLKYMGTGIIDNLQNVLTEIPAAIQQHVIAKPDYVMTITTKKLPKTI